MAVVVSEGAGFEYCGFEGDCDLGGVVCNSSLSSCFSSSFSSLFVASINCPCCSPGSGAGELGNSGEDVIGDGEDEEDGTVCGI